jgi:hypothetical protein
LQQYFHKYWEFLDTYDLRQLWDDIMDISDINMKKRKPNPKEKGKYKTSTQNWGVIWTTVTVIRIFMELQEFPAMDVG